MSHKKARQAYEARLGTWAAARSPVLLVAYENDPFTPATGTTYLRAFCLPAATDSQDLEGAHRAYLGVFQVNVVAPLNTGGGAANGIADELAALFVNNTRITISGLAVQQISPAAIAPAVQVLDRYVVPVSWRYRADTT